MIRYSYLAPNDEDFTWVLNVVKGAVRWTGLDLSSFHQVFLNDCIKVQRSVVLPCVCRFTVDCTVVYGPARIVFIIVYKSILI
jgi:hypothetical protein